MAERTLAFSTPELKLLEDAVGVTDDMRYLPLFTRIRTAHDSAKAEDERAALLLAARENPPGRKSFYKAATTDLSGPHYGLAQVPYLPGTTHRAPNLDFDPSVSCAAGLYYTSHRRVAARWGPVVLKVTREGAHVRTDQAVKPVFGYNLGIEGGKYNKYRTDRLTVDEIVGIVGTSPYDGDAGARRDAEDRLYALNGTLRRNGRNPYRITGNILERLRTKPGEPKQDILWELEEAR